MLDLVISYLEISLSAASTLCIEGCGSCRLLALASPQAPASVCVCVCVAFDPFRTAKLKSAVFVIVYVLLGLPVIELPAHVTTLN